MEINTEMVKELRQRTGAGVLDSKKALQETQGNMERAIELLREKGLARAAKKVGREAKEGVVEAYTSADRRLGVLVEVNCETDFVARTDDFKSLTRDIVMQIANANPPYQTPADLPDTAQVQQAIAKLGENIQVRRFVRYAVTDNAGLIETYAHAGGRIAVMVELNSQSAAKVQTDEFKTLAHDVAMQVAAANPRYLHSSDVPADVLEAERSVYRVQLAEEQKPANMIDKIVEGKLQKFYEEACLLNQPFIRDDKLKISALLKAASAKLGEEIQIRRFVRYELGD